MSLLSPAPTSLLSQPAARHDQRSSRSDDPAQLNHQSGFSSSLHDARAAHEEQSSVQSAAERSPSSDAPDERTDDDRPQIGVPADAMPLTPAESVSLEQMAVATNAEPVPVPFAGQHGDVRSSAALTNSASAVRLTTAVHQQSMPPASPMTQASTPAKPVANGNASVSAGDVSSALNQISRDAQHQQSVDSVKPPGMLQPAVVMPETSTSDQAQPARAEQRAPTHAGQREPQQPAVIQPMPTADAHLRHQPNGLTAGQAQAQQSTSSSTTTSANATAQAVLPTTVSSEHIKQRGHGQPAYVIDEVGEAGATALRAARSLRQQVANLVDQPRSETASASPALMRAAQLDQALRLEQAGMMQVTSSMADASQPRPTTAAGAASFAVAAESPAHSPSTPLGNRFAMNDDQPQVNSFASQAVRGLTAMVSQRGGSMLMRLDPPELGALRVQMTIVGGSVTASFTASSQHTQALLDRSILVLRQSLESQGLTVERLTVNSATASSSGAQQSATRQDDHNPSQQQQQHGGAGQHDAAGSESRGRREHASDTPRTHWSMRASKASFESLLDASNRFAYEHAGVGT